MSLPPADPAPPLAPVSLSRLGEVTLDAASRAQFDDAMAACHGSAAFRNRKKTEFHEFLALAQLSRRIHLIAANLEDSFQVHFILRCPAPVMRPGGNLEITDRVHVHLNYREDALRAPQPGYSFVHILGPAGLWLPNAAPIPGFPAAAPIQGLCLGTALPPGIRVRELVFMTYAALTLQSIQMDLRDAAGVLNAEAAGFWQQNASRIPLTREPFLTPR